MEHCENIRTAIQAGKTALGIELGSTRIKAVLIDENHKIIAKPTTIGELEKNIRELIEK